MIKVVSAQRRLIHENSNAEGVPNVTATLLTIQPSFCSTGASASAGQGPQRSLDASPSPNPMETMIDGDDDEMMGNTCNRMMNQNPQGRDCC